MIDSKSALDTLLNQRMAEETPASVESKLAAWEKSQKGEAMLAKQRDDLILYAPRDGVIGYRTVSYTHLDVYKRQIIYHTWQ